MGTYRGSDMIRFDSVSKRYRGAVRPALDGVTLEIGAGEFVFLVGASGSGKSSLLRLVLREEKPSTGEIHVLGQRLTSISTRKVPYFRRSLGVVFQDFRLLPAKTVYDNVAFTLQVIGRSRGYIQTTVPDVLETVGLGSKAQNFPNELSGGEQQRVAIARAVVNKPSILLADEPTGNLDPRTSEGIMQVLERINTQGTTVVMATHDVTLVDKAQKRVVELVDGRIVRDELEATYVTSSVPIQRPVRPDPDAPVWARRGAMPATAATPTTGGASAPAATGSTPVTGPVRAGSGTGSGAERTPATGPIWVRSDTGPTLLPGEHAPWRAAPVAPPADGARVDPSFTAPVRAPRAGRDDDVAGDPDAARPRQRRSGPPSRPLLRPADRDTAASDDEDGNAGPVLPHHLDFVTGLGLRSRRDDDEVGPSS